MDQAIFISSGDNWTVDNYGTIYGEDAKAINIKSGDNTKITNRSGGTIKTDGANGILIWGADSDDGENTEIYNYGTISAAKSSVKVANTSSGTTITNYSGGSILATNTTGQTAAIQIDADDTTTRYICLRSKIQDSLTRQLHKHQFDQKIIQGYSRMKSIYNMRWRHKSSSIVISIFFSLNFF